MTSSLHQSARTDVLWRVATASLVAHAIFSIFSAYAFGTFLIPPYPEWLQTPQNQRVMALGYTYGGATTVTLGAISGLAFLVWTVGLRPALLTFLAVFTLAFTSEYVGTRWDFPFGAYEYSSQLGYKIGGRVPFNIPTSWFYMLVASLAMCGRFLRARDDAATRWWWALVGGIVLTLWDVSMDPAMVKTHHWFWEIGDLSQRSAFAQLIGRPLFYGMPLTNWLGWLLTGIIAARVMVAIIPPSVWSARIAPHRLPLALYAVNGVLPIVICLRWDMVPAGVLGTLAMALPLWAAWRGHTAPAEAAAHRLS